MTDLVRSGGSKVCGTKNNGKIWEHTNPSIPKGVRKDARGSRTRESVRGRFRSSLNQIPWRDQLVRYGRTHRREEGTIGTNINRLRRGVEKNLEGGGKERGGVQGVSESNKGGDRRKREHFKNRGARQGKKKSVQGEGFVSAV